MSNWRNYLQVASAYYRSQKDKSAAADKLATVIEKAEKPGEPNTKKANAASKEAKGETKLQKLSRLFREERKKYGNPDEKAIAILKFEWQSTMGGCLGCWRPPMAWVEHAERKFSPMRFPNSRRYSRG